MADPTRGLDWSKRVLIQNSNARDTRADRDRPRMPALFPFSAIVGQDEMKLALLIAATDPTVGGVLVFGDRGTGKSTAVRALAGLLPPMQVV